MGGVNKWTPIRPFVPVYALSPLLSDDINAIRMHYGLQCNKESKYICVKSALLQIVDRFYYTLTPPHTTHTHIPSHTKAENKTKQNKTKQWAMYP